jgi:hypothetical protein
MRKLRDGKRVRVVEHLGVEGYIARWTHECSGCTTNGESGGSKFGPFGCHECGYTGRRRNETFIPFDPAAYRVASDRAWTDHLTNESVAARPG